jgi:RNA-directed DNA polymerase
MRFGLTFTRYADDICVSGTVIPSCLLDLIKEAISASGFTLKHEKTRFFAATFTSKVLTRVNISSSKPRLPKARRREIEHQMHFIQTFGYLSHIQKGKIRDLNYLMRLRGNLEFWRFIEPDNPKILSYIKHLPHIQQLHSH